MERLNQRVSALRGAGILACVRHRLAVVAPKRRYAAPRRRKACATLRIPTSLVALCIAVLAARSRATDEAVPGKRYDPPRIYFSHSSLIKDGVTSAIKGQVNFLDLYVTPIDNASGEYTPQGFSYSLLVPAFVVIADAEEQGLTVTAAERQGQPYKRITKSLPAGMIDARCLNGKYGTSHEWLWFRIDPGREIPAEPQPIEISLRFKDRKCFTDTSRLDVYEALTAPRLPAKHFKLWLHYGPRYRMGKWDELADYMAKAGFNVIQSLESLEFNAAMRKRGFYLIYQQSGSYSKVYDDDFRSCIEQGRTWFAVQDATGQAAERLRAADATLLDFEPGPAGRIDGIKLDDWLLAEFRARTGIPAATELTEELIRTKYFTEWIDMRQDLAAQVVRNWADYCRSVNPDIDTIITQGGVHRFDTTGDVDHGRYADHVTYCDPMNFVQPPGLRNMKKWMQHVPRGQFTGCQNSSPGGYGRLFISDRDIMLQTLGAAMIGCKGTSVYTGLAMDAANFVLWNRVITFMAQHQEVMFEGTPDPPGLTLTAIPKEDTQTELEDGTKVRNMHPDWDTWATIRGYHGPDLKAYLAVINNRHREEPCYVKLAAAVADGPWLVVDREHEEVFRLSGKAEITADALAAGIHVQAPPLDYRGYSLLPATAETSAIAATYTAVELEPIREAALAYPVPRSAPGPDARLLFHADFENGPDAVVAAGGSGAATVTGSVTYEASPGGKGIHLSTGASLKYLPEGNIDLQKGRFHIRFKPLWHGGDAVNRFFLWLKAKPGLMYLGKIDKGRFLCNMFDASGEQHWPHGSMRNMGPGEWHTAVATWDTGAGIMRLYVDGEKQAESRSAPWRMGKLDNSDEDCRMTIGASPIVIDEIKIWDRP